MKAELYIKGLEEYQAKIDKANELLRELKDIFGFYCRPVELEIKEIEPPNEDGSSAN